MPESLLKSLPKSFGLMRRHPRVGLVTARLMSAGFVFAGLVFAGLVFAGLVFGGLVFAGAAPAAAATKAQAMAPAGGPLMFGMSEDEASAALGVPLSYVRGSRGNELLLAVPNVKGSALTIRSDGLYVQFRRGRLTGWKGDWGTAKPPFVGW